jgi:DNA sulfur modification protein DndD
MIIKQLRICDFLTYPGEQVFDFPNTDDSNLIIVLGPGNSGKTTLIRALKFLLYGKFDSVKPGEAHTLINNHTKAAAKPGEIQSGWVEATIEHNEEELCLRRTVRAAMIRRDVWAAGDIVFEQVIRDHRRTHFVPDHQGVFQNNIRTLVPETLFDAFYFQGEPLDGKLLGGVTAIRHSLSAFLHEDQWEEAEQEAESIRSGYVSEIHRLNAGNEKYQELLRNQESWKHLLKNQQNTLANNHEELKRVQAEYVATKNMLDELVKGTDISALSRQLTVRQHDLDDAQGKRQRCEEAICRLVNESLGIPFLLSAMPVAARILIQLKEQNVIPADLSERFVDRVIEQDCCVCGTKHTAQTRAHWLKYKEKTLSVDLNRGLSDLLSLTHNTGTHSFLRKSRDLQVELGKFRNLRGQHIVKCQELQALIKSIEDQLAKYPVEEIRKLGVHLSTLSDQREKLGRDVGECDVSIKGLTAKVAELNKQVDKARPKGAAANQQGKLERLRDRAEQLRDLIAQTRQFLHGLFHQILKASVSQDYDQVATDGSKAVVDYETLMPAIERDGARSKNLGGGMSQLLALAYVVALSKLRRELHQQMQQLQIGLGKIDDQSFILDSPFDKADPNYSKAIARFLLGSARQTVISMLPQQWNLVRDIFEKHAIRIYGLRLYSPPERVKHVNRDDFSFPVGNTHVDLLAELPANETAYTKLIIIK